jgi:hypothetical protein
VSKTSSPIVALFGIYDADATIVGEVSYWIGARFGIRHCSLCDITHSLFTQKSEWQQCQKRLAQEHRVDFQAYHRNDAPVQVLKVASGKYPVVISKDASGNYSIFMDNPAIENCGKSPQKFFDEIVKRLK